jgi:hypothetical protein
MEWRAAMARSVDDVDSISSAHEPMGPTFTSVDGSKEIQPLPTAAVDQDERPPVSQGLRNPVLDIHLATQRWPKCSFNMLATNPKEAMGGQRQTVRPLRVQISRSYRFDRSCHRASSQRAIFVRSDAVMRKQWASRGSLRSKRLISSSLYPESQNSITSLSLINR